MAYRYYSIYRPVMLGGYPQGEVVEIHNFNKKENVEAIGKSAWGYIEYAEELSKADAEAYELIPGWEKTYYTVGYLFDEELNLKTVKLYREVKATIRPHDNARQRGKNIMLIEHFETKEEAEKRTANVTWDIAIDRLADIEDVDEYTMEKFDSLYAIPFN